MSVQETFNPLSLKFFLNISVISMDDAFKHTFFVKNNSTILKMGIERMLKYFVPEV